MAAEPTWTCLGLREYYLKCDNLVGPLSSWCDRCRSGCPDCAHDCFCSPEFGPCPGHPCYTCGEMTYGEQPDKGINSLAERNDDRDT